MKTFKSWRLLPMICVILIGGKVDILSGQTTPRLTDPHRFRLELFADLAPFGTRPKALQITITPGAQGFAPGLYVTSPFAPAPDPDQLFYIDVGGNVSVVTEALNTPETLVFAVGAYGSGMLISEPSDLRIRRLESDGSLSTFASLGTEPFGPAALAYDPTGTLFVTDFTSGSILRVAPDGSSAPFASIPLPSAFPGFIGAKALTHDGSGRYSEGFVAGTFSVFDSEPSGADAVYAVSPDGSVVTPLVSGLSGLELITLGPGGAFGSDLFLAALGGDLHADGGVFTLTPDGTLATFLADIDVTHLAFDTEGVLGGGMFVADFNESIGAARIWRITPIPEPASLILLATGLAGLAAATLWKRKPV